MSELLIAIISAITSVVVVLVTYSLNAYRESKQEEKQKAEDIISAYLNPLRFYLVENYFRLAEILKRATQEDDKSKIPVYVSSPEEISAQPSEWFNGHGCYLISSCYLTARLFYQLDKVRQDLSYLRLSQKNDTELITLITILSRHFGQDYGIYYLIQPSIGTDMYLAEQDRLITYREFCQRLQDANTRVWFDRLLAFYIATAQGKNPKRVENILGAIQNLSLFLDQMVGGGSSLKERLEIEGIKSL
ncbi:MAG: hypothetical protein AAFU71_04000 [Cyanobacteria bacterium J06632_22]